MVKLSPLQFKEQTFLDQDQCIQLHENKKSQCSYKVQYNCICTPASFQNSRQLGTIHDLDNHKRFASRHNQSLHFDLEGSVNMQAIDFS